MKFTTTTDAAARLGGYGDWLYHSGELTEEQRDDIFNSLCHRVVGEALTHVEVAEQFIAACEEYAPGMLDESDRQTLILSAQEADCHAEETA